MCPTIHPYFDITDFDLESANHTAQRADCTITPYAREQMRRAVCILAMTGHAVMSSPSLLADIRAEFEKAASVL